MATFCGKCLTEDQIKQIADYVIEEISDDTTVGEWMTYFSSDQQRRFKQLYDKHMGDIELYSIQ